MFINYLLKAYIKLSFNLLFVIKNVVASCLIYLLHFAIFLLFVITCDCASITAFAIYKKHTRCFGNCDTIRKVMIIKK